jgi:hypothetical protein
MNVCIANTIIPYFFGMGFLCKSNSCVCAYTFLWPHGKTCPGRAKTKFLTIVDDFSKKAFFYTMSLIISKLAKLFHEKYNFKF